MSSTCILQQDGIYGFCMLLSKTQNQKYQKWASQQMCLDRLGLAELEQVFVGLQVLAELPLLA